MEVSNQEHIIPPNKLKSFSISGDGKRPSYESAVIINGLSVGKWIRSVEFIGVATELPSIKLIGRLDQLDIERKQSWGIN